MGVAEVERGFGVVGRAACYALQMVTAEEQPSFVYRDEFERRSAEFDRRFTHLDDGLRELRQGQKDLQQGLNGVEQHQIVLEQEQKALGQRFSDFKENTDRRFTMLTWAVGLLAGSNLAMLGWLIARGGG